MGRIKSYCGYNAIIMRLTITDKNYEKVQIVQNEITYNKFVHCLVATCFSEQCGTPKSNDWQVHHIDFNSRNNKSSNLVWVSQAEHIKIHNEAERSKKENGEST